MSPLPPRLLVWWDGVAIGEIGVDEGVLRFRYAPTAARPISRSLPIDRDAPMWQSGRFFANLLPDGDLRVRVARHFGVSSDNDYALLVALGGDCAGALTLLPDDVAPADLDGGRDRITDAALAALADGGVPARLHAHGARLSLAGAQDKLPVVVEDDNLYTPRGRTPSTHILKLPVAAYRDLAVNELLTLQIAREIGLPTVDAELRQVGRRAALLVRRFDRRDGRRIHQEDFCQATGRAPTAKYEREGGPTFAEVLDVVREESADPIVDADVTLRWHVFNVFVGNADSHAKNLALVREDATRVAPLYDLVCTRTWPALSRELAMSVGGEHDPGHIDARRWDQLARDAGFGPQVVRAVVERTLDALPNAARAAAARLREAGVRGTPLETVPRIAAALCRRGKALLRTTK